LLHGRTQKDAMNMATHMIIVETLTTSTIVLGGENREKHIKPYLGLTLQLTNDIEPNKTLPLPRERAKITCIL